MATFFSQLYAATATPRTVDVQKRVSAGISHGRMRYARAEVTCDQVYAAADVIRLKQFKSGDRINSIKLSCIDGGTTSTIHLGIHKSGTAHDGAVVDADLFASSVDITTAALSQSELFDEAGLDDFDRGKALWELNGDSSDPMEDWDLSVTIATESGAVAAWQVMVEVYYTSGD